MEIIEEMLITNLKDAGCCDKNNRCFSAIPPNERTGKTDGSAEETQEQLIG